LDNTCVEESNLKLSNGVVLEENIKLISDATEVGFIHLKIRIMFGA
jgi:hypothetical protein